MKISKSGGLTILVVFCLSIGILIGQYTIQKAVNIEFMREATLFSVHAAYLRGCIEAYPGPGSGHWDECVQGAIHNTRETREILEKEPERMFNPPPPPTPQKESKIQPTKPLLEELIKKGNKGIII